MRNVLIFTDRKDFPLALSRHEKLLHGVQILSLQGRTEDEEDHRFHLRVDLRVVSGTAFALWILRRLRSIPGDHRIEIRGESYPLQMPEAIDLIADALVHGKSREHMVA